MFPLIILWELLKTVTKYIIKFTIWFYTKFLPFVIKYFGIPLFLLGLLLGLAFAGGTMFFIIIFFIFMYYFVKGTIFSAPKNI
jgi:hypothetical protein